MPVIHVRSESEYETVLTKAADKLVIVDFTAKWYLTIFEITLNL